METEEQSDLKNEIKKQLVIGLFTIAVVTLAVYVEYKAAEEAGTHELEAKVRGWRDRQRQADEFEKMVTRDMNKVMFEVYQVLGHV
jgi:hypothetical protein